MIALTIAEIAAAVGVELREDFPTDVAARTVTAVTTDSRDVPTDSLFVALRGEVHDGHDHLDEVFRTGAVGALTELAPTRPGELQVADTWQAIGALAAEVRRRVDPTVIAVTGSVGKTTTKDLTAAACRAALETVAARGSFNNEIGVPLTCLALTASSQVLIAELGARGVGHIAALVPIVAPDIAIVTAVAGVHLELFGDIDQVAQAKGELVEGLSSDGVAILNADDARVLAMRRRTDAKVLTYSRTGGDADLRASAITLDRLGRATFSAATPWGAVEVALPLAGEHHVSNALAALGAACSAGVSLDVAAYALADAPVSAWRCEIHEAGGVVVLNDAYNANPTSVAAALDTLATVHRPASAATWAVLGVMAEIGSDHDREHHAVGDHAARSGLDRLIVVGEAAAAIAEGARSAGMDPASVTLVGDADAARDAVVAGVTRGDVILVKASRVAGLEAVAIDLLERLEAHDADRS